MFTFRVCTASKIPEYLIELNTTGTFPDETDKTPMVTSDTIFVQFKILWTCLYIFSATFAAIWQKWVYSKTMSWIVTKQLKWHGRHRTKHWTTAIRNQMVRGHSNSFDRCFISKKILLMNIFQIEVIRVKRRTSWLDVSRFATSLIPEQSIESSFDSRPISGIFAIYKCELFFFKCRFPESLQY